MNRTIRFALLSLMPLTAFAAVAGGCQGQVMPGTPMVGANAAASPSLSSGEGNTFNHDIDQRDPFEILKQQAEEGPPDVATRLHSCRKISYSALGNLLTSRGVDLTKQAAKGALPTAGDLYRDGAQALGAPNYAARVPEAAENTTASATKLFDVFVQAAPEIIAAMPSLDACKVDGTGAQLFEQDGTCRLDGVSCLLGRPATQQHVDLCTQMVKSASSVDVGERAAVASLLAAAHTCE